MFCEDHMLCSTSCSITTGIPMSVFQGQQIYQTTAGTFLPIPMSSPSAQAQIVQTVAVPAMHSYRQSSEYKYL